MKEQGALLNVDVCFKVVRTDSVLNFMNETRQNAERRRLDPNDALAEAMTGATVVTRYNQKTYKIDRIDFAQSPASTFDKQGTPTTYQEFYKTRYNEEIKELNQPLLINKDRRTGNEVALIPELCQLTGLTDSMRADFRLMQDMAKIVHTNAEAKMKEITHLMNHFKSNEKCVEKQKLWHLNFSEEPQSMTGFKYTAGNLLLGAKPNGSACTIDVDKQARQLDRLIQGKMFTQTELSKWAIFHGDRDAQIGNQFKSTMKECLDTCGYSKSEPQVCAVKPSMKPDNWIRELKK